MRGREESGYQEAFDEVVGDVGAQVVGGAGEVFVFGGTGALEELGVAVEDVEGRGLRDGGGGGVGAEVGKGEGGAGWAGRHVVGVGAAAAVAVAGMIGDVGVLHVSEIGGGGGPLRLAT